MFLTVFVSVTINIAIIIAAYFVIKHRLEKTVINKDIIGKVKKEVNSMILQLNETTLNNVNLIEQAVKTLDKKIILADKKKFGLKIDRNDDFKRQKSIFDDKAPEKSRNDKKEFSYSPEKIVNQTQKNTEKLREEVKISEPDRQIDEGFKKLSTNDKVKYLLDLGYNGDQIRKKLGLSSGELEFLMNIENIKK